ncbi:MAG: hypothetical protein C4523_20310 [Myxococcales bacterium]|nr:MAG: hypothetical protein C4523_20310 [Myxococcales bacterium]
MIAPVEATETTEAKAGYTSFFGKVYDGATPEQVVWEEKISDGPCRLLKPRIPFCSTPCTGGAVCVEDERCRDYPVSQNIGAVHVTGVANNASETEFDLEPISNGYQTTDLPYPAFSEGDPITVSAAGSDFTPAFALEAYGIAPFGLSNSSIVLSAGQALTLIWTPAGQADISIVKVKLDISHHGGSKGKIECEAEDNGSLVISASLISELLDLGATGFPTIVVARQATGSTEISNGRVDLVVSSSVEVAVEVPGVISCNSDDDCPEGQTCETTFLMCQ